MPPVSLAAFTTLGVGGPADELVQAHDLGALDDALESARSAGRPALVLGGGSNIVFADEGFAGTVVRMALTGVHMQPDGERVLVRAAAGEDWSALVARCVGDGLSGTECLSGIPGSAGATPIQNVGAYGQEVSQAIVSVQVWDRVDRRLEVLPPERCRFAYRDSIFKHTDRFVVTEVCFALERSSLSQPVRYEEVARCLGTRPGERAPLELTAQTVLQLRKAKGMVLDSSDPDTRSVGSFFMNPLLTEDQLSRLRTKLPNIPVRPAPQGSKVPAAWLVEMSGFSKGYARGTAAISSKHALALTVRPGGSAADLLALAREVRDGVFARFGVLLEPEPLLVGLYL